MKRGPLAGFSVFQFWSLFQCKRISLFAKKGIKISSFSVLVSVEVFVFIFFFSSRFSVFMSQFLVFSISLGWSDSITQKSKIENIPFLPKIRRGPFPQIRHCNSVLHESGKMLVRIIFSMPLSEGECQFVWLNDVIAQGSRL